jgi:uncharacterized membrane protein
MQLKDFVTFIIAALVLLSLDAIYFYFLSGLFISQIQQVQKTKFTVPNPIYLLSCYAVLTTGLFYFILRDHRSIWDAAFLGFIIYAIFETTNGAMFNNWKISTVVLDTAWGAILFGTTTAITYSVTKLF